MILIQLHYIGIFKAHLRAKIKAHFLRAHFFELEKNRARNVHCLCTGANVQRYCIDERAPPNELGAYLSINNEVKNAR